MEKWGRGGDGRNERIGEGRGLSFGSGRGGSLGAVDKGSPGGQQHTGTVLSSLLKISRPELPTSKISRLKQPSNTVVHFQKLNDRQQSDETCSELLSFDEQLADPTGHKASQVSLESLINTYTRDKDASYGLPSIHLSFFNKDADKVHDSRRETVRRERVLERSLRL